MLAGTLTVDEITSDGVGKLTVIFLSIAVAKTCGSKTANVAVSSIIE